MTSIPSASMAPIDFERLQARVETDARSYQGATPFPHIVMDDFLPETVYRSLLQVYPKPGQVADWRQADAVDAQGRVAQKLKLGYSNELRMPAPLRELLYALNCGAFIRYLEKLTGIPHLLSDPHMFGGGLHQYLPGAVLRVHADFNKLPGFELDRRLNLLIYLNEDWREEWQGDLELWDRAMHKCQRRIAPLGNRCVVFSTTSTSFHGMPEPLACPSGTTRKSIALYYYSNGRPADEMEAPHSTLWQARPGET